MGNVVIKILVLQIFCVNLDLVIFAAPMHVIILHNVGVIQAFQESDFSLDPLFEVCLRPVIISVEGDAFTSQYLISLAST